MPRKPAAHNQSFRFQGVTSPNTTQVPDQYLDELLPILSGAELKVLLYITRRTFGFKKSSDNISLSQMLGGIRTSDGRQLDSGVGLTKKTLLQAIRSLETQHIILTERRRSAERGDEPTCYRLNFRNQASEQQPSTPVGEKVHQGGGGITTPGPRGKNYATQHTVKQQTDFDLSNLSKGDQLADEEEERQEFRQESPNSKQASMTSDSPLKEVIARRVPQRHDGASDQDTFAIRAALERFAEELGDSAPIGSSVTRAVRLFERSQSSRDGFIDALFAARGEVLDRYRHPGNAPLPRNRMAYFFAIVEDRLGLKTSVAGERSGA